jgi:transposase
MRYELSTYEWSVIRPMLPNKPRGVPRVDDRHILNASSGSCDPARRGAICRRASVLIPPATIASFVGAGLAFGIRSWMPSLVLMTRRCR